MEKYRMGWVDGNGSKEGNIVIVKLLIMQLYYDNVIKKRMNNNKKDASSANVEISLRIDAMVI